MIHLALIIIFFLDKKKKQKKIKANTKPPAVLPGQRHRTSLLQCKSAKYDYRFSIVLKIVTSSMIISVAVPAYNNIKIEKHRGRSR